MQAAVPEITDREAGAGSTEFSHQNHAGVTPKLQFARGPATCGTTPNSPSRTRPAAINSTIRWVTIV